VQCGQARAAVELRRPHLRARQVSGPGAAQSGRTCFLGGGGLAAPHHSPAFDRALPRRLLTRRSQSATLSASSPAHPSHFPPKGIHGGGPRRRAAPERVPAAGGVQRPAEADGGAAGRPADGQGVRHQGVQVGGGRAPATGLSGGGPVSGGGVGSGDNPPRRPPPVAAGRSASPTAATSSPPPTAPPWGCSRPTPRKTSATSGGTTARCRGPGRANAPQACWPAAGRAAGAAAASRPGALAAADPALACNPPLHITGSRAVLERR
jgi:hypothetical protein